MTDDSAKWIDVATDAMRTAAARLRNLQSEARAARVAILAAVDALNEAKRHEVDIRAAMAIESMLSTCSQFDPFLPILAAFE